MNKGFAMLLSVLVLAAIGMGISTTLLMLSVSSAQSAGTAEESQKAKGLANACTEKALQVLVVTPTYLGSNTATIGTKTCTYTVSAYDAYSDIILATSTIGQTTRKVQARVSVPNLYVITWQEI